MLSDDRHWRLAGYAAGLWCILVGIGAIVLWQTAPMELATRYPALFGMKYNAAVALILIGAAFLLALSAFRLLPILLMLPVFIYGVLALSQHLFDVDFGIDLLIYRPFTDIGTSLPGRIAPNTAICFILVSFAIALRAARGRNDLLQILCGYITTVIAATAVVGYVIDLDAAHDWVAYTRMSMQSAICFLAIGTGILFVGARPAGYHRMAIAASLGVATYLILLSLAYVEVADHGNRQMLIADRAAMSSTATTLSALILISGITYAGLVLYSYWNSRRYRRSASNLSESQRRLAAIIDNAADGIITINGGGIILSANPACQRMFGYLPEEMVGRNVKMLMPEPHQSAHDDYLGAYRRTGEAKLIGSRREMEGRRKDGGIFPLDLSIAKVELSEGTIYSGIIRDISERKHFERQLLAANAELEEFAYRTSHDLRSPIASSIGLLNISRELLETGDNDALDGTLGRMERNFSRLDHLIQNIIVLTRDRLTEEQNQRIVPHDVVQATIGSLCHQEDGRRIRITNHIPQQLTIVSKPSKFDIIVGNLLSNAIKYHDPQEADPRVDIFASKRAGSIRLTVEDNGIGVPEEKREHLFRMFKRLHPNRSFGSGLGLYILKKSVESLNGTASFEAKDKGSRFFVELPDGDGNGDEHHSGGG